MQLSIKKVLKRTPIFLPLSNLRKAIFALREKLRRDKEVFQWNAKGKPIPPPPVIKQRTIESYAKRFELEILVETGTYHGDMIEAMKSKFNHIISIELSKELHMMAKQRFEGFDNIELICGDSGRELEKILPGLNQPILFWLDGHYSGGGTARGQKDTPIFEELNHILKRKEKDIIIIDDARCFGSNPAYPSIDSLEEFIKQRKIDSKIYVQDDSIRIFC